MTLTTLCSARDSAPESVRQRWKVRTENSEGLDLKALCPSGVSEHRSFVKLLHPPLRIKMLPEHQNAFLKDVLLLSLLFF